MSKKKPLIFVLLAVALLYSCSDSDKEGLQPQKVAFSFTVASTNPGGRIATDDLPSGTSLLISLADNTGNPVLTHHKISLLHLGGSYITDPLELAPGRYSITDFMLVSDSSEVLFAAPQRNAPLSKLVVHSLPFSFLVNHDKVANVEMEVLDARLNRPEDFGYAAFDIHIVHPFRISVFKMDNSKILLTDAKAYLYKDSVEQFNFTLAAKINLLSFKGDPDANYTLVVKKNGYANSTTTFNYNSFIASHGDNPLKVILEKIPTVTMNVVSSANFTVNFTASGTITIDWGDGQIEPIYLNYAAPTEEEPYSDLKFLNHDYKDQVEHTVNITGDLPLISELTMYGVAPLNALELSDLTELQTIELLQSDFDILDISHNSKLKAVVLSQQTSSIKSIKFSLHNDINYLQLDEVGDMDNILKEVYNNVVANNINGGRIIGNFDPEISTEIQAMVNDFGWTAN